MSGLIGYHSFFVKLRSGMAFFTLIHNDGAQPNDCCFLFGPAMVNNSIPSFRRRYYVLFPSVNWKRRTTSFECSFVNGDLVNMYRKLRLMLGGFQRCLFHVEGYSTLATHIVSSCFYFLIIVQEHGDTATMPHMYCSSYNEYISSVRNHEVCRRMTK